MIEIVIKSQVAGASEPPKAGECWLVAVACVRKTEHYPCRWMYWQPN